ncbi:MAG: preprotein translocase subunit SecA [bacterium]
MVGSILRKIFGSKAQRDIKRYEPILELVNSLEPAMSKLSDEELRAKTDEFRHRVSERAKEYREELERAENRFKEAVSPEERQKAKDELKKVRNRVLEDVLPEAFAVVREVAKRTLNMRHFDVQIMGGVVLHEGKIAEMATGEGKTLVATLPVYLNSLGGYKTHLVTVNDYLAKRDAQWMGPIYECLGLTVGFIQHDMSPSERRMAYSCDVTYVTNNELGFDYLRDNMAHSLEECVLGKMEYAIIDEVDSILIDEARTPLIISGPTERSPEIYYKANRIIPQLQGVFIVSKLESKVRQERQASRQLRGREIVVEDEVIKAKQQGIDLTMDYDYVVEEKNGNVYLTENGVNKSAHLLGINPQDTQWTEMDHYIKQSLRAYNLFLRDVHYVVKDGQVVIVDEFTGRLMPGRRWSDGLHQAIEAKENLRIAEENQTLATITFQNYFKLYNKLAGMTGTAATEAEEFWKIYGLDVVVIPTNKPLDRTNYPDVIYKTDREKWQAIVKEIEKCHKEGRPVLVGTTSVEKNEKLSELLKKGGIPHIVLNAKDHEGEAKIIAQAGRVGRVTVATNMAGRGIDIVLGGEPKELKGAVLSSIICEDSLKYVSSIVSNFKSPEAKFNGIKEDILFGLEKMRVLHRGFIDHEASRIKDSLINFVEDYTPFYEAFSNYTAKLREAIIQEQKYLEEIFSITEISTNDLQGLDKLLEKCKSKTQDLEYRFTRIKQNMEELMDLLKKEKPLFEDIVNKIIRIEEDNKNELEIVSKLKEAKEEQAKGKRISHEELGKRIGEIEKKLEKIKQDFHVLSEEYLSSLTEYTSEFKELEIIREDLDKKVSDRQLINIRENLLEEWRFAAYSRKLSPKLNEGINNLENIVRNQFQKKISPVIDRVETAVLGIRMYLREFEGIRQDLQKVNSLSEGKMASKDLTAIKDISALSAESRMKIGILSEDFEVYAKEHEKVVELGGLHVIGTERHEARRIDNQLRGRAGRQGDPGSSRFYLSLEDELMRLFGSARIAQVMDRLGLEEGQDIQHPLITRAIGAAQKKVEAMNFDIRKQLLEYDNVMSKKREVVYKWRRRVLEGANLKDDILAMFEDLIDDKLVLYAPPKVYPEQWNLEAISEWLKRSFGILFSVPPEDLKRMKPETLGQLIAERMKQAYDERERAMGEEMMRFIERMVTLQVVDTRWKEHLYDMDKLREGIGLRAYGQKDPLIEYKRESEGAFDLMQGRMREEISDYIFRVKVVAEEARARPLPKRAMAQRVPLGGGKYREMPAREAGASASAIPAPVPKRRKIGRNDPCPCGSGKKYKKCCGR